MAKYLTYRDALAILGKKDRPFLEAVDQALGGIILASGLVGVDWLFALVDQKNEGKRIIANIADFASARIRGTRGRERQDLIAAAHAALVISAYFEAFHDEYAPIFKKVKLTAEQSITIGNTDERKRALLYMNDRVDKLLNSQIPEPWRGLGFAENRDRNIMPFFRQMLDNSIAFFEGLRAWEDAVRNTDWAGNQNSKAVVIDKATDRYTSFYIELSSAVPEFRFWASLGEIESVKREFRASLSQLKEALVAETWPQKRSRAAADNAEDGLLTLGRTIYRLNQGRLERPIFPSDSFDRSRTVIPAVGSSYVEPAYKRCISDNNSRISEDNWWNGLQVERSLGLLVGSHATSRYGTSTPLVILGNPGAGKSLLGQMLVAALPARTHTAVWIPLRHVEPNVPIFRQVEQGVELLTNGRGTWSALSEESADETIRVIVLDGLDELIMASGVSQSRYLYDIATYQQNEADAGKPVVVIVTSRTIVADRVSVPLGTTVLKLEKFSPEQVDEWLGNWNSANSAVPGFHPLSARSVLTLGSIGQEPLLLLLLSLYASDVQTGDLSALASSSDLYTALLNNFLRREAMKDASSPEQRSLDLEKATKARRRNIAIAAFAMFNRGKNTVLEHELQDDLGALIRMQDRPITSFDEAVNEAAETVGHFFFIHAPQGASFGRGTHQMQRIYEFLHATFGEFLIADEIVRIAGSISSPDAGSIDEWSGDRLIDPGPLTPLLSFQLLTKRGSVIKFLMDRIHELDDSERTKLGLVLESIIRNLGRSIVSPEMPVRRFHRYRPIELDIFSQQNVCYANLLIFLLFARGEHQETQVSELSPDGVAPFKWWQRITNSWRATLDEESWFSLQKMLFIRSEYDARYDVWRPVAFRLGKMTSDLLLPGGTVSHAGAESMSSYAQMLGDEYNASLLRVGRLDWRFGSPSTKTEIELYEALLSRRVLWSGQGDAESFYSELLTLSASVELSSTTRIALARCLVIDCADLDLDILAACVRVVIPSAKECITELAWLIAAKPEIANHVKEISGLFRWKYEPSEEAVADTKLWQAEAILRFAEERSDDEERKRRVIDLRVAVRALRKIGRSRRSD